MAQPPLSLRLSVVNGIITTARIMAGVQHGEVLSLTSVYGSSVSHFFFFALKLVAAACSAAYSFVVAWALPLLSTQLMTSTCLSLRCDILSLFIL